MGLMERRRRANNDGESGAHEQHPHIHRRSGIPLENGQIRCTGNSQHVFSFLELLQQNATNWRLRTTAMYFLTVQEAKSLKGRSQRSNTLAPAKEGFFLAFCRCGFPRPWLVCGSTAPIFIWHFPCVFSHSLPCVHIHVCVQSSPSHKDTSHTGVEPTPMTSS